MTTYAGTCLNCGKTVYTDWGNRTCPFCSQNSVAQARIERGQFERFSETKRTEMFRALLSANPDRLKKYDSLHAEDMQKIQVRKEEIKQIQNDQENQRIQLIQRAKNVIVTTGDLHERYEIIDPVYFQLNDTGRQFAKLLTQYQMELSYWRASGQGSNDQISAMETLGAIANIAAVFAGGLQDRDLMGNSHANFDAAFYIATQELKLRAAAMGGDAIVYMRQDLDLDTSGFQHFYLQMYGTTVRRLENVKPQSFYENNDLPVL